jgi:hypothetical protein
VAMMAGSPFASCKIRSGACESTPATSISMMHSTALRYSMTTLGPPCPPHHRLLHHMLHILTLADHH